MRPHASRGSRQQALKTSTGRRKAFYTAPLSARPALAADLAGDKSPQCWCLSLGHRTISGPDCGSLAMEILFCSPPSLDCHNHLFKQRSFQRLPLPSAYRGQYRAASSKVIALLRLSSAALAADLAALTAQFFCKQWLTCLYTCTRFTQHRRKSRRAASLLNHPAVSQITQRQNSGNSSNSNLRLPQGPSNKAAGAATGKEEGASPSSLTREASQMLCWKTSIPSLLGANLELCWIQCGSR